MLPDGILDSLRSLDCLEMNGLQSKVNSLRSIKHIQVEPTIRKSQLTCRCYSSAVTCMLVSRFSVNDQKPIKPTLVSCSVDETWKHRKINTGCRGKKTRHHSSCHSVASWMFTCNLGKQSTTLKDLKREIKALVLSSK